MIRSAVKSYLTLSATLSVVIYGMNTSYATNNPIPPRSTNYHFKKLGFSRTLKDLKEDGGASAQVFAADMAKKSLHYGFYWPYYIYMRYYTYSLSPIYATIIKNSITIPYYKGSTIHEQDAHGFLNWEIDY